MHKMATGKSDDELIQHDNKMRIGTQSEKVSCEKYRIIYGLVTKHDADANDNNDSVTLHDADANDSINVCLALHDAYTTDHFH